MSPPAKEESALGTTRRAVETQAALESRPGFADVMPISASGMTSRLMGG